MSATLAEIRQEIVMACLHDETDDINTQQLFRTALSLCVSVFFYDDDSLDIKANCDFCICVSVYMHARCTVYMAHEMITAEHSCLKCFPMRNVKTYKVHASTRNMFVLHFCTIFRAISYSFERTKASKKQQITQ